MKNGRSWGRFEGGSSLLAVGVVGIAAWQMVAAPAFGQVKKPAVATPAVAASPTKSASDKSLAWKFGKGDVVAYDVRLTSAEGDAGATHATLAAALSGRLEMLVQESSAERAIVGVTLADAKGSVAQNPSGWTPKAIEAIGEKDAVLGSTRALAGDGVTATLNGRGAVLNVDGYATAVTALKLPGGDVEQGHASLHAIGGSDEDLRVLLSTLTEVLSGDGVKPGATWTTSVERVVPGAGTLKEELTLTLKALGADNIANVAIVGKAALHDAVSTDLGKAELRESQISGDAKFDAASGRLTLLSRTSTFKIAMPPAVGAAAEVVEYRQTLNAALNTSKSKAGAATVVDAQEAMKDASGESGAKADEKTAAIEGPDFIKEPGDLEWGWTEGETMRYRISYGNSTKMNGLGEGQDFSNSQKITIDVTIVVSKVGEDKTATAQLSFDRVRMNMTIPMAGESVFDTDDPENVPPMLASFARPIGVMMKKPMSVEVSRAGIIKSLKGFASLADQFIAAMPAEMTENPEMVAQMKSQMTDDMMKQAMEPFLRILPEKPVKKGETWTVPGAKMGMGMGEAAPPVTYFFDDVQEAEGMRCAYVSTRQAGKVQNQGGEGVPQFKMKQGETTGKYIFIIELGKVLNAETTTSMSYGGDLPGQDEEGFQREYNSTTTSVMKIELIE